MFVMEVEVSRSTVSSILPLDACFAMFRMSPPGRIRLRGHGSPPVRLSDPHFCYPV